MVDKTTPPKLTPAVIEQINEMLAQAARHSHVEIVLVVKRGILRGIKPPNPWVPLRKA